MRLGLHIAGDSPHSERKSTYAWDNRKPTKLLTLDERYVARGLEPLTTGPMFNMIQ